MEKSSGKDPSSGLRLRSRSFPVPQAKKTGHKLDIRRTEPAQQNKDLHHSLQELEESKHHYADPYGSPVEPEIKGSDSN